MATDPDKENRHPNIVVHIPAAAAVGERRRRRDEAFAGLMGGRSPANEQEVTSMYNLAKYWAMTSRCSWDDDVNGWHVKMRKYMEYCRLVDEERAERDHREPSPLSR